MSGIRPNVLQMEPYSPGKPISEVRRELGIDKIIKLASNENPLGPSPRAVEAVRQAALSMHAYPDAGAFELKVAIGLRYGIAPDQILLGNGSDELIHMIGQLYLGSPEDEMIVGDPSFVRYDAAAKLAPSKLIKVPLDADYRHDLPAMAKATTANTKLIFIANPNNPTGTIVRRPELEAFLKDLPAETTTVLDEAYFEFAREAEDYPDSIELLAENFNVIGLRTFSKTFGLAGIRLGYGFASHAVVDAFDRAREPFNVNSLAQVAAIAALQDDEHIRATVENNRRGLQKLGDALTAVGAKVCESYANFVFADLGRPAQPVFQAFLRKGIIIRSGEIFGTPNCVRVSVGTEEETDTFLSELPAIMAS